MEGSSGDSDSKAREGAHEVKSYQTTSLLTVLSKLFENLFLCRLMPFLSEFIPSHQFSFPKCHFTVEKVHQVANVTPKAFENK